MVRYQCGTSRIVKWLNQMSETGNMVMYQCVALRIAHFPLNISSGQENEHIFLKHQWKLALLMLTCAMSLMPRGLHTFLLIYVWGRKVNTFSFDNVE